MSFCSFSKEYNSSSFTSVENVFLYAYLPSAGENAVKVYLYGLYLCQNAADYTPAEMSAALNIDGKEILDCYRYWEEFGLVDIVSEDPLMISYLPIGLSGAKPRKVNAEKYTEFNHSLQKIISERMISTNEYSEYFRLMETFNVRPEAMLMIAQYCVDIKGGDIGYKYISAVAKDFASRGITTPEKVEKELENYIVRSGEITAVLQALSLKRRPEIEDVNLFAKWTGELGFEPQAVLQAAKSVKKGSIRKLDELMMELYANKKFEPKEIAEFAKSRKYLYELAVKINKQLSYYCDVIDTVVNTYTSKWVSRGFGEDALLFVANYCFRHGRKDLADMDELLTKLYAEGIIDIDSVADYFAGLSEDTAFLKKLLEYAGQIRRPNEWDRQNLKRWRGWGFTDEVIEYAAELSAGKSGPVVYMNAILGSWKNRSVFTLEEAKTIEKTPQNTQKRYSVHFKNERKYTKEELDAIITDVDDIEI
ncbi:MAG: DnaD domain protein [Clostridia bacterium]|nr:DnaD domain protein [Clostridia bacterium]